MAHITEFQGKATPLACGPSLFAGKCIYPAAAANDDDDGGDDNNDNGDNDVILH